MFELYKAECRRFRWLALAAGGVHASVLLFFDRVVDPLQQPVMIYQLVGAVYAVAGVLLGLYQCGTYARVNHWIALLHRPLAPSRILVAVIGAGATMLSLAILLPLILLLVSHDMIGARFVDLRHWELILSGELLGLIGFFAGAYAMLSPRRYGWLIAFLALLPAVSAATGWRALLFQAMLAAVLALMVATVFKPDLEAPPRRGAAMVLTAGVLALCAHRALLLVGDFLFQALWIVSGTHPLNSVPPKGGIIEATRVDGADLFEAALATRHDRQASLWREQVRMSEVFELPTAQEWLPVRGELTNVVPMEFDDEKRGIRWTFSHDSMAYRGIRLTDYRSAGQLGGFPAPPLAVGENQLIAGGGLYLLDADEGALHRRVQLPVGEVIVAAPTLVSDAVVVLGDKALHFLDRRDLDGTEAPRKPFAVVPLPGPIGGLRRLHVVELLDGYLVSFTYGRDSVDGPNEAWQRIVEVDGGGNSHDVANRPLHADFPTTSRFARYWVSPALQAVRGELETVGSGEVPVWAHEPVRVPRGVWLAAALLALGSAAGAAFLARRRGLGRRDGAIWTAVTLVLSLPMLIAFWLIRPRPRAG